MDLKKNEIYDIEIIDVSSEGFGVGRIDDFVVFVPMTAIGDLVKIKLIKVLKSYGFGRLEEIITLSKDRVDCDCEVFDKCGGCCFRHINYEKELEIKQKHIKDNFERIGKIDTNLENIIANCNVNEYRNKAQFPVGYDSDGKAVFGFYASRSHRLIPYNKCMLQPKEFNKIADIIIDFFNEYQIPLYDENTKKGLLRHIFIRKGEETGEVMVALVVTKGHIPKIKILVEKLTKFSTNVKSVVVNVNNKDTNVILGEKTYSVYGNDCITDVICDNRVDISCKSFYQVNKKQAEILYNKAYEFADCNKDDIVFDVYCGTGTIGLGIANRVKQVIGIEIISQAIENARQNALKNNINNIEFICGDAKDLLKFTKDKEIKPNVVILDPPRKGCSKGLIDDLEKMNAEKIIMISCNPATASRDCNLLEQKGYKVCKIQGVDMFSRTNHVETIVSLRRK